jgi:hypothetical protein
MFVRTLCALVPALQAELSRSGGNDGRARVGSRPHDDPALGAALRASMFQAGAEPGERLPNRDAGLSGGG